MYISLLRLYQNPVFEALLKKTHYVPNKYALQILKKILGPLKNNNTYKLASHIPSLFEKKKPTHTQQNNNNNKETKRKKKSISLQEIGFATLKTKYM